MTLPVLVQATGADHATVTDRLKSLEAEQRIALFKYSGGSTWPRSEYGNDENAFFWTGSFLVEIIPQARKYFEDLEQRAERESDKRIVFISCGQFAPAEILLGKRLAARVSELTPFEGYFAENQSSLEGLSSHIFHALDQCVAFVGVMHNRGEVETLGGKKHTRASVWIEQEIAIAAFLTATRAEIPVLVYAPKGIKREGVREQLKLAPIEFTDEDDLLADFETQLNNGVFKSLSNKPRVSSEEQRRSDRLRASGEELHSLFGQWLNSLFGFSLRRIMVMQGKLTYNQCLDLDIKEGKPPYDFGRIELLIDLDFPILRPAYDRVIDERTKLHKIEVEFKRSYEQGDVDGERFVGPYVKLQKSMEVLGEEFQQQLLKCLQTPRT